MLVFSVVDVAENVFPDKEISHGFLPLKFFIVNFSDEKVPDIWLIFIDEFDFTEHTITLFGVSSSGHSMVRLFDAADVLRGAKKI